MHDFPATSYDHRQISWRQTIPNENWDTQTHTQTHTHTYIHTHTHTRIHTHAQTHTRTHQHTASNTITRWLFRYWSLRYYGIFLWISVAFSILVSWCFIQYTRRSILSSAASLGTQHFLSLFIHTCMYVYIHVYTHTHTHRQPHTYTYTHMHTRTRTCARTQTRTRTNEFICIYLSI